MTAPYDHASGNDKRTHKIRKGQRRRFRSTEIAERRVFKKEGAKENGFVSRASYRSIRTNQWEKAEIAEFFREAFGKALESFFNMRSSHTFNLHFTKISFGLTSLSFITILKEN